MADAKIDLIGEQDIGVLVDLYNEVFTPPESDAFFRRRFEGRRNVTIMVAVVERRPVGFIIGFELTPTTYFSWLCGVSADYRRAGIATQLMQAQQAWAQQREYSILRFECQNQHRPMLQTAITEGFDLVGIRYDTDSANNVVIFEKDLR